MASALSTPKFISVREYLASSYSPDCDYVDGSLEERNVGEFDHAVLQRYFTVLFALKSKEWSIEVFPELRVQVAAARFRIPDVCVLRRGLPREQILTTPPLICIEILSAEDRLQRVQERVNDYLAFGVEHIWIVDPSLRIAYRGTTAGFERVLNGELTVPGTPIRVVLGELFAELDRA